MNNHLTKLERFKLTLIICVFAMLFIEFIIECQYYIYYFNKFINIIIF